MTHITALTLTPLGEAASLLPYLSIENCQQTLEPLPNGELRRSVNGQLVHTGQRDHWKYRSKIYSKDKLPPAFEGIWTGATLEVGCIQNLTVAFTETDCLTLARKAVDESVVVIDPSGKAFLPLRVKERTIYIPKEVKVGCILYRPLLYMKVAAFQIASDEWEMTGGWTLKMEEI